MNEPLGEIGTKSVAESAIKALSPTKSTYYLPVAVATASLCWVAGEAHGFVSWATYFILFSAIVGLTYLSWKSRLELRGASVAEEFRMARTIALSGSFITLASALHTLSEHFWAAAIHLLACSLQIFVFIAVAWKDQKGPVAPPRVNLIQLTLILSVLLGGGAYMLGQAVHSESQEIATAKRELSPYVYHGNAEEQAAFTRDAIAKEAQERRDKWSYRVIAFGFYLVWFTTGVAWLRSRQTKRTA